MSQRNRPMQIVIIAYTRKKSGVRRTLSSIQRTKFSERILGNRAALQTYTCLYKLRIAVSVDTRNIVNCFIVC
jgi:hypothetical protein